MILCQRLKVCFIINLFKHPCALLKLCKMSLTQSWLMLDPRFLRHMLQFSCLRSLQECDEVSALAFRLESSIFNDLVSQVNAELLFQILQAETQRHVVVLHAHELKPRHLGVWCNQDKLASRTSPGWWPRDCLSLWRLGRPGEAFCLQQCSQILPIDYDCWLQLLLRLHAQLSAFIKTKTSACALIHTVIKKSTTLWTRGTRNASCRKYSDLCFLTKAFMIKQMQFVCRESLE